MDAKLAELIENLEKRDELKNDTQVRDMPEIQAILALIPPYDPEAHKPTDCKLGYRFLDVLNPGWMDKVDLAEYDRTKILVDFACPGYQLYPQLLNKIPLNLTKHQMRYLGFEMYPCGREYDDHYGWIFYNRERNDIAAHQKAQK